MFKKTARPKVIYLADSNPALGKHEFAARWLQHGALAMTLPIWRNMWKYAQCDPLPIAGEHPPCDAIGLVWYRSWQALDAIAQEPQLRQPLLDDELLTFSEHVRNRALMTEETVLREGPEGGYKLFILTPSDEPSLRDGLLGDLRARRIVESRAVANGYTSASGLAYRLVWEAWYSSRAETESAATRHGGAGRLVIMTCERPMFGPVDD